MARIATAERLGAYVCAERFEKVPAPVVARAIDCVQDAVGCALGAQATQYGTTLESFARARGGQREAHVLGTAFAGACTTVAFVNALLINALDYDDIHQGHIGATVVAAALAAGEKKDIGGRDLIAAIVVGYEVGIRLAEAMAHSAPRRTIHGFGTWQAVAAAAAAARALGLDDVACAHALAIAGANAPVASVMKTVYGDRGPDMVKNNFGTAAEVGVTAALLADAGLEGSLDLFDGDTAFWRMYGADACDFGKQTQGLGRRYAIRHVGFKQFSACRILQSTLEAATLMRARLKDADGIDQIFVHAPKRACLWPFDNRRPKHMWAAQFSTPYTIGAAMAGLDAGPAWFAPGALQDKTILRIADTVKLIALEDEAPRKPHRQRLAPAKLRVHAAGRWFTASVPTARGEASRPFDRAALREKFLRLVRSNANVTDGGELWLRLGRLASESSVRSLMRWGLSRVEARP